MSTVFTVTVYCDRMTSPACCRQVSEDAESPRRYDTYATELFQQGWLRGFKNTDPSENATSDTMVAYDVCPACADLDEKALPARAARAPAGYFLTTSLLLLP